MSHRKSKLIDFRCLRSPRHRVASADGSIAGRVIINFHKSPARDWRKPKTESEEEKPSRGKNEKRKSHKEIGSRRKEKVITLCADNRKAFSFAHKTEARISETAERRRENHFYHSKASCARVWGLAPTTDGFTWMGIEGRLTPNGGEKGRKGKKFNRSTKNRIKINKRRKKLLKVRWKSVMSELVSKSCDMQWRGHLDNCRLAKRHRTDTHLQVH